MSSTWVHQPLRSVLETVTTGSTPSTTQPEFYGGTIPWFTPGDIGIAPSLVKSSRYITDSAVKDGKARLFTEGTLLVTCIGDIGRVGILRTAASSNQQITALSFKDHVNVEYAYFWFITHQSKLQQLSTQSVVPILNNTRLQEVEFDYPPLPEQQRIAGILSRADRLRRLRRYALEMSDGYLQAVFLEMFGDPATNPMGWKIVGLSTTFASKPQIGTAKPAHSDGKQLVVRVGEIGRYRVALEECATITLAGGDLKRFTVQEGDFLLARAIGSADHLGKASIMQSSNLSVVYDSHVMRLRFNREVLDPWFFLYWLKTSGGRTRFMRQAGRTAVQYNVNTEQMSKIEIPLPPSPEQRSFISVVHQQHRLQAEQREALRQAEHLFQTLLHGAFRGEG